MVDERPNVIFVSVDCLRYDRCGFNKYSKLTTPFLDSLSNESYIFDRCFATGPYTPESFPGIMAGIHAKDEYYTYDLQCKAIPDDAPTLAGHLSQHGYTTLATITNPHLSENRNFHRGFDKFQNLRIENAQSWEENRQNIESETATPLRKKAIHWGREQMESQSSSQNALKYVTIAQRFKLLSNWPTVDAKKVKNSFIDQLSNSTTDSPIFGWMHLMDVHTPLNPERYLDRDGNQITSLQEKAKFFATDAARMSDVYDPQYGEMYDGVLRYIDKQMSELVDYLKSIDEWDNTILIVTGDHGEAFGERGKYEHPPHYMYDELLHVPLLVRVPATTGKRIKSLFSLGWLHELISELVNIEPADMPATTQRDSHIQNYTDDEVVVADSVTEAGYTAAVRSSNLKHVEYRGEENNEHYTENPTVYRIEQDQAETSPVKVKSHSLHKIVDQYYIDPSNMKSLNEDIGVDAKSRLEQLGYMS